MNFTRIASASLFAGLSALAFTTQAQAQSTTSGRYGLDAPNASYFEVKAGQSQFNNDCGVLYGCDRKDTSYGITYGREINPNYAVEVGYTDHGKVSRGGGDTKAQSANVSLVGKLPMDRFALFGKLGAVYGKTSTSTALISDVQAGNGYGWGATYGVGVSYDLTQNVTVALQWEEANLHFAGEGQEKVNGTNLGVRFKF